MLGNKRNKPDSEKKKHGIIILDAIKNYKNKKIEEYTKRNESFNYKDFLKNQYDIHNDSQREYLMNAITTDHITEFENHYKKYQFVLDIETRKELQNLYNQKKINKESIPDIIKKNFLPQDLPSIKTLLTKVLVSINELDPEEKELSKLIINSFSQNHIYFIDSFNYLIPTRYSEKNSYKYNKLLFDIAFYFLPYKGIFSTINIINEEIISEKLKMFKELDKFIQNINSITNDDEFINKCDYLFNCLEIIMTVPENKRNKMLFHNIINMCLPFSLEIAKNLLNKIRKNSDILVNDIPLLKFDIEKLNENSYITLKDSKKSFKVKANGINWYLDEYLMYYFSTDEFILCFSYNSCLDKNYIMDNTIYPCYKNLFKLMIKSNIIKEAMMQDEEAKQFDYPFQNDEIFEECCETIHYLPIPAFSVYGLTDKNSYNIYINPIISTLDFQNILTSFDNKLKTQSHEFKHATRIYYHLFNNKIKICTPKPYNKIINDDNLKKLKEKIDIVKDAFKVKNNKPYPKLNNLDYGDIFELNLFGITCSQFYLSSCILCLKENTWTNIEKNNKFFEDYIKSIKSDYIKIIKNNQNFPFISSIMNYFSIISGNIYYNELSLKSLCKTKESNENEQDDKNTYENICSIIEKTSHYYFKNYIDLI